MTFYSSFPNVSIGNLESSERLKKEWIPFFKGMTKKQGNDILLVIPECIYRESIGLKGMDPPVKPADDKRKWIPSQAGNGRKKHGRYE
jgi:hypothetical protein